MQEAALMMLSKRDKNPENVGLEIGFLVTIMAGCLTAALKARAGTIDTTPYRKVQGVLMEAGIPRSDVRRYMRYVKAHFRDVIEGLSEEGTLPIDLRREMSIRSASEVASDDVLLEDAPIEDAVTA